MMNLITQYPSFLSPDKQTQKVRFDKLFYNATKFLVNIYFQLSFISWFILTMAFPVFKNSNLLNE